MFFQGDSFECHDSPGRQTLADRINKFDLQHLDIAIAARTAHMTRAVSSKVIQSGNWAETLATWDLGRRLFAYGTPKRCSILESRPSGLDCATRKSGEAAGIFENEKGK